MLNRSDMVGGKEAEERERGQLAAVATRMQLLAVDRPPFNVQLETAAYCCLIDRIIAAV